MEHRDLRQLQNCTVGPQKQCRLLIAVEIINGRDNDTPDSIFSHPCNYVYCMDWKKDVEMEKRIV